MKYLEEFRKLAGIDARSDWTLNEAKASKMPDEVKKLHDALVKNAKEAGYPKDAIWTHQDQEGSWVIEPNYEGTAMGGRYVLTKDGNWLFRDEIEGGEKKTTFERAMSHARFAFTG